MRNLKRALSLALASVMLLGMMVIGSSAATFTDADEIVNTEAATITAGFGLFAGSEGKFNPNGKVTRAQMATVIVKMLYGSEINADSYKGSGKFSDVASFEGGWAEGYINLCANLGIVSGYGDGTFKPGQELTTAEAITMLLNALDVDAGEGTWPITVMAAAEKIELYNLMVKMETAKPTTNEALTRDQLSVLVWNAMNYSPKGINLYVVGNVEYEDPAVAAVAALAANTTVTVIPGKDTLVSEVFESQPVKGVVISNQATTTDPYTTLSTADGLLTLNIETGLDLIGHDVVAYYAEEYVSEKDPGVAYAVVDQNKTVVVAMPDGGINTRAEYRAAFGSQIVSEAQRETAANSGSFVDNVRLYQNYSSNGTGAIPFRNANFPNFNISGNTYCVPNGTYVVNEETNTIVAYHEPKAVSVSMVTKVTTTEGNESITVLGEGALDNTKDDGIVIAYDGIAADDLVAVVEQGDLYVLSKLESVTGTLSGRSTNRDNGNTILTMNGQNYEDFGGTVNATVNGTELFTTFGSMDFKREYTLYLYEGKLVGYDTASASANLSEIVYVVDVYNTTENTQYGTATTTYAQVVDMDGKEANIAVNKSYSTSGSVFAAGTEQTNANAWTTAATATTGEARGFYTFEKVDDRDAAKEGIMKGAAVGNTANTQTLFVYDVVREGGSGSDHANDKLTAESKRVQVNTVGTTTTGTFAYITEASKIIKASGSAANLETSISNTIKYTVPFGVNSGATGAQTAKALLSQTESGNLILEALVVTSATSIASAEDIIYVSAEQVQAPKDANADGFVYDVYNAKTGEILTLTMRSAFRYDLNATPAPLNDTGFWEYEYDEADKVYDLVGGNLNSATTAGFYFGETFDSRYGNLFTSTGSGLISDWDASKAIIVDTRSKDAKDLIPEITTLAELEFTDSVNGEDATITLDIWASDVDDKEIGVIFVRNVVKNTYTYNVSYTGGTYTPAVPSASVAQGTKVYLETPVVANNTVVVNRISAVTTDTTPVNVPVQSDANGSYIVMPALASGVVVNITVNFTATPVPPTPGT